MKTFEDLNLSKQLLHAVSELGFVMPTPIQEKAYPGILSGRDVVGIAQTGTGKTLAYMLPILQQLKFSKEVNPRVLVLVPTRELVMQVAEDIKHFACYMNVRTLGVYGEANIKLQKLAIAEGIDILVGTPGRLYDLALSGTLSLKGIKKLVIDEVDVMLDLGFRPQLANILDLLPVRRQNMMFSATMTADVDALIDDFFVAPARISTADSGTPLDNISQLAYPAKNFFTKVNLLTHLLADKQVYHKVLVFVSGKAMADRLFECLVRFHGSSVGIIHSNKSQNFRIRLVEEFESGTIRVLIATDLIARGLDLNKVSHVVNFDTPDNPEIYMHRIGRTGRAGQAGRSLLFYTPGEATAKEAIETLMAYEIPVRNLPAEVVISAELIPEEQPRLPGKNYLPRRKKTSGRSFHEKIDKNKKVNEGGSYKKKLAAKYSKPKTRGDKNKSRKKK